MDKLAPERKAEVKNMYVFRLVTKLEQASISPEQLELMDRNALLLLLLFFFHFFFNTLGTLNPEG